MPGIITTRNLTYSSGYSPFVYTVSFNRTTKAAEFSSVTTPANIVTLPTRPTFAGYRRRIYIGGMFSRILVLAEDNKLYPLGLQPPTVAPALAAGASSTGVVGDAIGYVTLVHKVNGSVVSESNPSAAATTLTLTNTARDWTGIPTTSVDPHVTHARGYVSMLGFLPRKAWEISFGVSSMTGDDVPTATLANYEALPNDNEDITRTAGVPPYGKFVTVYHDRLFIAGDPAHPYRVWYSEVEKPWAVNDSGYFDIRAGEAVTGMAVFRDQLIVFCQRSTYEIQGYSDGEDGITADMQIRKIHPNIGCISHYGIVNINGRLWFPSEDGIRTYDGSFAYQMDDLRTYWKGQFDTNYAAYLQGFAIDDRTYHTYKFIPYNGSTAYDAYVGHYKDTDPDMGGNGRPPAWTFDKRNRVDTSYGSIVNADGRLLYYTGSPDGHVRQENVSTDNADDTDTYAKAITIATKAYYFGDPGGDKREGKSLIRFWSYVESESDATVVKFYGGDESAYDQAAPNDTDNIAASASSYSEGGNNYTAVAKTTHVHRNIKCSGRAFVFEYTVSAPESNWKFRGFGGVYGDGVASRGYATVS